MSLILQAFPMAFLISPDANDKIANDRFSLTLEKENLNLVKIATNLRLEDINYLMENINVPYKYSNDNYIFENGLKLNWKIYNGHYCAFFTLRNKNYLSAKNINPASYLLTQAEELLRAFDTVMKKNVRNISSGETFYYCYDTPYKLKEDILNLLKAHKIENITKQTDLEIRFRHNFKNYKYLRNAKNETFYLESEQKISLLNIIAGEKSKTSRKLKTNYTDRETLLKTLEEYGARGIEYDEFNVSCDMSGMKLLYSKNFAQGSYDLEISQISDESACDSILQDLKDEYSSNIQDITYRTIIERIKDKNLRLESEEIGEDNSIILTIDVG